MPQRHEVLRERARTSALIRVNDRHSATESTPTGDRDHRHGRALGSHGLGERIHRRDNDDRLGGQGGEVIEGAGHVVRAETIEGHDRREKPSLAGGDLQGHQHRGGTEVGRGRGHDADNARAGGHQGTGHGVRAVSQLINRGLHALARPRRHTPLAVHNARHRLMRDTDQFGHVRHRRRTTIARHTGLPPACLRLCSHRKRQGPVTYHSPHFLNNS